jgi:hypothetical protein
MAESGIDTDRPSRFRCARAKLVHGRLGPLRFAFVTCSSLRRRIVPHCRSFILGGEARNGGRNKRSSERGQGVYAKAIAIAAATLFLPCAAASEGLPPIPPSLLNVSAVSCVRLDDLGAVSGAFLITSTGDPDRDRDLLAWIKQLHWAPAKAGEQRNVWFPMPVAIGDGISPPPMPASCAPPGSGPRRV